MRSRAVRALGLIGFGLGPTILFAGCGDDESGARRTLNSIEPTSYAVRPPATTEPAEPEGDEPEVDDEGRTGSPQEYTVQPNDTVWSIANRYGITAESLANFNEWPGGTGQMIHPDEVIRIPPDARVPDAGTDDDEDGTEGDGTDEPETTEDTTEPDGGDETTETTPPGTEGECVEGTHTIEEGDIPTRVASQYDVTVEQLEAANAGNPAYQNFWIGEDITIPCD